MEMVIQCTCSVMLTIFSVRKMSVHDEQDTRHASIIFKNINFEEQFRSISRLNGKIPIYFALYNSVFVILQFPFLLLCSALFRCVVVSFVYFFIFCFSFYMCTVLFISCFLSLSFIFVFSFYYFEDNGKISFPSCRPKRANKRMRTHSFQILGMLRKIWRWQPHWR